MPLNATKLSYDTETERCFLYLSATICCSLARDVSLYIEVFVACTFPAWPRQFWKRLHMAINTTDAKYPASRVPNQTKNHLARAPSTCKGFATCAWTYSEKYNPLITKVTHVPSVIQDARQLRSCRDKIVDRDSVVTRSCCNRTTTGSWSCRDNHDSREPVYWFLLSQIGALNSCHLVLTLKSKTFSKFFNVTAIAF